MLRYGTCSSPCHRTQRHRGRNFISSVQERVVSILVGQSNKLTKVSNSLLRKRQNLVVLHVDLAGIDVQIALSNPSLTELLNAVRSLLQNDEEPSVRIAGVLLSQTPIQHQKTRHPLKSPVQGLVLSTLLVLRHRVHPARKRSGSTKPSCPDDSTADTPTTEDDCM